MTDRATSTGCRLPGVPCVGRKGYQVQTLRPTRQSQKPRPTGTGGRRQLFPTNGGGWPATRTRSRRPTAPTESRAPFLKRGRTASPLSPPPRPRRIETATERSSTATRTPVSTSAHRENLRSEKEEMCNGREGESKRRMFYVKWPMSRRATARRPAGRGSSDHSTLVTIGKRAPARKASTTAMRSPSTASPRTCGNWFKIASRSCPCASTVWQ